VPSAWTTVVTTLTAHVGLGWLTATGHFKPEGESPASTGLLRLPLAARWPSHHLRPARQTRRCSWGPRRPVNR